MSGAVPRRTARNAADIGQTSILAQTFVAAEEEGLLAHDRPADVAANLMAIERRDVRVRVVEVVLRIERLVTEEPEGAAAQAVRSGARDGGDDAAAAPAILRAVVVDEDLELANGFHAQQTTGGASRRSIALEVHVGAVELVANLVGPRAGDRDLGPHPAVHLPRRRRRCDDSRLEQRQLAEVPTVERQLANLLRVDDGGNRGAGRVDNRRLATDCHHVLNRPDADRDVQGEVLADAEPDVRPAGRLESRQLDRHLVLPRFEAGRPVAAVRVRRQRAGDIRFDGSDVHRGARERSPGLVGHDTHEGGGGHLSGAS